VTKLAIGLVIGLGVGIVVGAAIGIHAAQEIPDETVSAATDAGVDPVDLQGASNTTGLAPRDYLCQVGEGPCPDPPMPRGYPARVRLTHYVEYGVTYGGGHPYDGSTACSWNWPLYTTFVFPDGETFVCNDRGLLGNTGWLDLWRRPDVVRRFGPFTTVQVIP
jgi:hypothetical protein